MSAARSVWGERSIHSSEDFTVTVPEEHALTILQVQQELPELLLTALERRWFDGFDASQALAEPHLGGDLRAELRFLHILELAHGQDVARSFHLLNMQNVLSTFRDGSHSLVFALRGDGRRVDMYLGVRRFVQDHRVQTADYVEVLRRVLRSNFPGISLSDRPLSLDRCQTEILDPASGSQHLACVTGIPSLKQDAAAHFTQSLDRLVDALRGERYTFLVLAEPIAETALAEAVNRCRRLSEEIHGLVRRSIAASQSRSTGVSTTSTQARSINVGTGGLLGMLFGLSYGRSWQTGITDQRGESAGLTVSQEALNKTAEFCEKLLDHYLARLQNGRNLGFWNVGLYLASNDPNTFLHAQGVVRGLFAGKDTHFEPLRVLDLDRASSDKVKDALYYLRNPRLDPYSGLQHPLGEAFQHLTTPLTTEELSILLSMPRREVPGIKLTPMADFGLNPPASDGVSLGRVIYRGDTLADEITIPLKKLTQHTFVTGITGAGKTNTCLVLLREAHRQGIPFLVIEPAKTEYRRLLADPDLGRDLWVFTPGEEGPAGSPFRLNPFEFARDFPLLTHIDLLKAVFNATFPMYGPMPFILEEAILEVYVERGWDVASSSNRYLTHPDADFTPYLPRLEDLYRKIDDVVASKRYAQQLTMDISAALKARLKSLLNGGKGRMLNVPRSIPFDELLGRPTVLELRRVGDNDEKAFVMALLLVRLYEQLEVRGAAQDLTHLTLIEEAHRLLRNVPVVASMEVASPRGKAVEMFTDILAEVREYGEGIVIVDQVPAKLAPDVVKNTNLKVLHRLVAQDDRDFVGNAMNLTTYQKEQVVRLKPGQAVVHSEGLDEPVLVKVDKLKDDLEGHFRAEVDAGRMLGERMSTVRVEIPDAFHRYVGCKVCDTPCQYFSDQNAVNPQALATYRRLYAALRFSPIDAIPSIWQVVQPRLQQQLMRRLGTTGISQGVLLCHLIQLAEAETRRHYSYYQHSGGTYAGVVRSQQQLADVLRLLLDGEDQAVIALAVSSFRPGLTQTLTVAPVHITPGCRLCRRRCAYGFDVQVHRKRRSKGLTDAIAVAAKDPARRGRYGALVDIVEDHAVSFAYAPVDAEHLPHLIFCWLANVSTKLNVLRRFQAEALARSHRRSIAEE